MSQKVQLCGRGSSCFVFRRTYALMFKLNTLKILVIDKLTNPWHVFVKYVGLKGKYGHTCLKVAIRIIKSPDSVDRFTICFVSAVNHTIRVHSVSEYIECCLCKKVTRNKLNFRNHILNVHHIKGRDIVQSYGKIVQPTHQQYDQWLPTAIAGMGFTQTLPSQFSLLVEFFVWKAPVQRLR